MDALRQSLEVSGGPDMSLEQAVDRVLASRNLSPALKNHVAWHLHVLSRDDWAAGAKNLSLMWWDDGYEVYGYGDSVFVNGAGAIIQRLAVGLNIRLDEIVNQIEHGPFGVKVTTDRQIHEADAVIVTLPLGVLKAGAVKFTPPLPDEKAKAISRLGMGSLTKVILHYERPFWPTSQYVFGHMSDEPDAAPTSIINLWKTHHIPALVMMIGGEHGRSLESWTEEQVDRWAMGILQEVFDQNVPPSKRIEITQWDNDPFSRGSYSFIALGSTPADIEALAAPVGERLLFAGEATVRTHWACLHSAYVSGLREAARLTGDTSILPSRSFTENRRWRDMLQRANRFFNLVGKNLDPAEAKARVDVLARGTVFGSVPPNDLKVLAMMFERREFADGEMLCQAGDPATCVFAIASGEVSICLPGLHEPVATRSVGDIVGEYGMFLPGGRSATLRAKGQTSVLTLDYKHFKRFLLAFPESMYSLFEMCVERLHATQAQHLAHD